jgi:hypothetical protein
MQRSSVRWEKVDEYHAVYSDWSLTRYAMEGVTKYLLWSARQSRSKTPQMVPFLFDSSAEAGEYVGWIERSSKEYTLDRSEVDLTKEQRELL